MGFYYGTTANDNLYGSAGIDYMYGFAGSDNINGYGGNDTIYGHAGNDYLNGGTGADALYGGTDNDRYIVDNSGDTVTEYSGQGTDRVDSYISSYTLPDYVENLYVAGSGAYSGYGNALANVIWGNSNNNFLYGYDGNDTIYGYAGNDYINGGVGADAMYGGTDNDRYIVDNGGDTVTEYSGQGTDRVDSYISSYTLPNYVENLYVAGSGAYSGYGNVLANTIWGNNNNNYLYGYGGNDTIYGYAGNDYINGGGGADAMYGGTDDDRYIVDNTGDTVTEYNGQGTDLVYSYISSYTLSDYVENLYVYGSSAYDGYGNALANTIWGNGNNNSLYGYDGNDTIYGYAGNDYLNGGVGTDALYGGTDNDHYIVDNSGDTVTEYSGQGTDRVDSYTSSYTLPDYVENLYVAGSGAYYGYGNALANVIWGNSNNNFLYGYDGNDTIYGYAGNDYLNGGIGTDALYGGTDNDRYIVDNNGDTVTEYSGQGTDRVDSYISSYTLPDYVENLYVAGSGAYSGYGNVLANTIWGNNNNNSLYGYADDDTIYGYGGDDYINGGTGNDVLSGGTGNDYVYSGHGRDTIGGYGGTANEVDRLVGYDDGQPSVGDTTDKDLFLLGSSTDAFYDGDGAFGYALINNFDWRDNDEIQVYGAVSNYTLSYSSITGDTSVLLNGDLLAIVTGVALISNDLVSA